MDVERELHTLRSAARKELERCGRSPELSFYTDWLERLVADTHSLVDARRARAAKKWGVRAEGPGVHVAVEPNMARHALSSLTSDERAVLFACPVVYRNLGMLVVHTTSVQQLSQSRGFTVLGPPRPMTEGAWDLFDRLSVTCPASFAYELAAAAAQHGGDRLRIVERLVGAGVSPRDVLTIAATIEQ